MAKKPKLIQVDFTPPKTVVVDFSPRVFMKDKTHSYLFLREVKGKGLFLTMIDAAIEVVRVDKNSEGLYVIQERNEGQVKDPAVKFLNYPLEPYPRDLLHAARVYWDSTLSKSAAAERELRLILGLTPSAVSPSDKADKVRSGATSLADLCLELGLEPSKGRKLLRGKVEKPGERWEWTDEKQIVKIKGILSGKKSG